MITIDIITLFPSYFSGVLTSSLIGKAVEQDKVRISVHDLRRFGIGKHLITDDRPYGGGAGMVLLVEPLDAALSSLGYKKGTPDEKIVLTSAQGSSFTQQTARDWSNLHRVAILCGHYEGVDERVAQFLIDEEIRIGEYVLTGGEPAAAVMLDAITRLQPEVLGNESSLIGESHDRPGQLGFPQYSRPSNYKGWKVPNILLGGDHQQIAQFREQTRKQDSGPAVNETAAESASQ